MIDELRSLDWVPRSVRNRAREIERAMAELENRHKRTPSDDEVAGELGITVGRVRGEPDRRSRAPPWWRSTSSGRAATSGGESTAR